MQIQSRHTVIRAGRDAVPSSTVQMSVLSAFWRQWHTNQIRIRGSDIGFRCRIVSMPVSLSEPADEIRWHLKVASQSGNCHLTKLVAQMALLRGFSDQMPVPKPRFSNCLRCYIMNISRQNVTELKNLLVYITFYINSCSAQLRS